LSVRKDFSRGDAEFAEKKDGEFGGIKKQRADKNHLLPNVFYHKNRVFKFSKEPLRELRVSA
jgi:hypothetical protein